MRVHLVNPSDLAFGVGVITPRWLYVIAGATPERFGDPVIVDETLEPFDPREIASGDVVGIGIHTFNSLRGYEVGQEARARGATVVFGGVHASLYPDDSLVQVLHKFRRHGLHVLGSFIFGLPTDRPDTFDATVELAEEADIAFAQFVMLSPLPGTLDFQEWEKALADDDTRIAGHPLTRYWLIPQIQRPKLYIPHPTMSPQEIRERTQQVWDRFYSFASIWKRSRVTPNLRSRLAFLLISKLYRQMYANTGIATDSARVQRSTTWARRLAKPCRRLFVTAPMPELRIPAPGGEPDRRAAISA